MRFLVTSHCSSVVGVARLFWIVLHFLLATSVIVSLLTGFRIAAHQYAFLQWLTPALPQGEVFSVHMLAASLMCILVLAYGLLQIYRYRTGIAYRLKQPVKIKPWSYHRCVQIFGLTICILAVLSGLLMHFFQDITPSRNLQDATKINVIWLRYIHFFIALLFIAYIFMHAASYFILGGFSLTKRVFIPSIKKTGIERCLLPISVAIVFMLLFVVLLDYCFNSARWFAHKLSVVKIRDVEWIEIDGLADDAPWKHAKKISLFTFGGVGFFDGSTPVQIKAVHNTEEIFFHIQWKDNSESNAHLPIVKTNSGWKVMHNGFQYFNETKYYEDKLAVLISPSCSIAAAGTAHLGSHPIKDMPANWHGKGYHYSKNFIKHDLWHWKAVRTNGKTQADDNYIGPPEPLKFSSRRYTAGYQQDTKQSGAYVMNWQWFKPESVIPKRLPKDHLFNSTQKNQLLKPSAYGTWFDYAAYRAELDHYPVGLTIPSVLYRSNQFEGDRGDVRAKGIWQDGWWSLELVRKKNTQSHNDVKITDGVCMWVAAFDHAQIGHTRHLRPIEIVF